MWLMWTRIQNLRRSKQTHEVNTTNSIDLHMIVLLKRISNVNNVNMNSEIIEIETTTYCEDMVFSKVTIVETNSKHM